MNLAKSLTSDNWRNWKGDRTGDDSGIMYNCVCQFGYIRQLESCQTRNQHDRDEVQQVLVGGHHLVDHEQVVVFLVLLLVVTGLFFKQSLTGTRWR